MLFFIIYMFALFHPYLHRTSLSVTLETFSYSMFMIVHFAKFTKKFSQLSAAFALKTSIRQGDRVRLYYGRSSVREEKYSKRIEF